MVWEGWRREASPYPDPWHSFDMAWSVHGRFTSKPDHHATADQVRTLLHHLETCEALPMGGVKVACTIAGNRLDRNDLMLHFRA